MGDLDIVGTFIISFIRMMVGELTPYLNLLALSHDNDAIDNYAIRATRRLAFNCSGTAGAR